MARQTSTRTAADLWYHSLIANDSAEYTASVALVKTFAIHADLFTPDALALDGVVVVVAVEFAPHHSAYSPPLDIMAGHEQPQRERAHDPPAINPSTSATPIEADNDLPCGEDYMSDDASLLRPTITAYPFENGRRYHAYAEGKYYFPNDEKEMERQDIEHQMTLLLMDGQLYICPLQENPSRILDLGTGTGIWAIDMADKFPDCEVIGTDLSPIQPAYVPPNCKFYVDNYEDEW
jgi:hypothetical protein